MNNDKVTIDLIIEPNKNGHFWGRIEDKGNFMPTGQGETIEALIQNVKDCIEDYQEHEGKEDEFWKKIELENIEFNQIFEK